MTDICFRLGLLTEGKGFCRIWDFMDVLVLILYTLFWVEQAISIP